MNDPTTLFPCPKCGVGREKGGVACLQCGWEPEPIRTQRTQQPATHQTRRSGWGCLGIALIVLSIVLMSPVSFGLAVALGLNNHDATSMERAFMVFFALGPYVGFVGIFIGIILCVIGFSKPQE